MLTDSSNNRSFRRQTSIATVAVAVCVCSYWAVLFYATHTTLPPGLLPGNSDKVVHFTSYGLLGALLLTLRWTRGSFSWPSIVARWFVLACYGAFDEVTQLLVNRTADVHDWFADISGAAVGLGLTALCLSRMSKSTTRSSEVGSDVADAMTS